MKIGFARLKSKAREIINRRRYTMPAIQRREKERLILLAFLMEAWHAIATREYKVDLNPPAGCWIESRGRGREKERKSSFRSFRLRKIRKNLYNGFVKGFGGLKNRNEILFLQVSIQSEDIKNYKNVRTSLLFFWNIRTVFMWH